MVKDLAAVISNFKIKGTYLSGKLSGYGHINDSYLIYIKETDSPAYLLQWINNSIFRDVEGLMKNFITVTSHLASITGAWKDGKQFLEVIPTKDGLCYFVDETGNYWRIFNFISGSHVYDVVTEPGIASEGGKAFGEFLRQIAGIPVESILVTIPDFHNLECRLKNFYDSVKADTKQRFKSILPEFEFVNHHAEEMLVIPRMLAKGLIPQRITHNDTKFNNIIFNAENKAICIVDLDTVMPGSVLFDFGDAIRTGANTVAEDEKNLSKVTMDINIFEAYAKGYLESTFDLLTQTEIEMLAFSSRFMAFLIGLRFLTDFLDGDTYYRTQYPGHNLDRARVQFKLAESMEQQFPTMQNCIDKIAKSLKAKRNSH